MSEGSYCQHKALKPADFKLNGTVLCWPASLRKLTSSLSVDRVQWPRLECHQCLSVPTAKHILRLALSSTAHRAFKSNMFLFQLARGGGSSENHDLEIKCEPKKSNRHKGGKQSQPLVTLFWLASRERGWRSLFPSDKLDLCCSMQFMSTLCCHLQGKRQNHSVCVHLRTQIARIFWIWGKFSIDSRHSWIFGIILPCLPNLNSQIKQKCVFTTRRGCSYQR